ncbi:MAG: hypothetical protein F6K34_19120, partial [Okeania sp. SIO4D6]|nr:hypothetical protein [Okeania sp. SIO4D6]
KTKKLYSIGEIAELLGCHRVTVQHWFGEYRRKDSGESDRLTGLEW